MEIRRRDPLGAGEELVGHPMTKKQHRWYLREWSQAFRSHWAGVVNGEAVTRPGRPECPMRARVLEAAGRLAATRQDGRLSPDLIRRACHLVGCGKDVSSWNLSNKQIDQVVAVFRVLSQVRDVAAQMQIDAAEIERARLVQAGRATDAGQLPAPGQTLPDADRTRVQWSIQHTDLPPGYVEKVSQDMFGTANWRSLPTVDLHKLMITAKVRAASRLVAAA